MRQIIITLLVLASGLHSVALAQTRAGAAPKPCSLLTQELVQKFSAGSKLSIDAAGKEVQLGSSGSACDWGGIMLQIDPFTPARLEELRKKDGKNWEAVPGIGDAAYLHNIRDTMAELFVRVGARTFGVVITIPVGSTAAAFKPNFILLANAIVPKLR